MTEKKRWSIADLREGRCAVKNDGTSEQLNAVLSKAFPNDDKSRGDYQYYLRMSDLGDKWYGRNGTTLPTQSVADFLLEEKQEEGEFKNGEEVEYYDGTDMCWRKGAYVGLYPGGGKEKLHVILTERRYTNVYSEVRKPFPIHYATQPELIKEGIESLSKKLGKEVKLKGE